MAGCWPQRAGKPAGGLGDPNLGPQGSQTPWGRCSQEQSSEIPGPAHLQLPTHTPSTNLATSQLCLLHLLPPPPPPAPLGWMWSPLGLWALLSANEPWEMSGHRGLGVGCGTLSTPFPGSLSSL